jgi:hypothetical protein
MRSALLATAIVAIIGILGYTFWYFGPHKDDEQRRSLHEAVGLSAAAITDIISDDSNKESVVSYNDFFAETSSASNALTEALARSQTAPISSDEKKNLSSYIVPLRDLLRLKEQEARKQLALSNASDSVQGSLSDLRSANYFTASVYRGAALKSLAEERAASDALSGIQKSTTARAKKFLVTLKGLRPRLQDYNLVPDATVEGFESTPSASSAPAKG